MINLLPPGRVLNIRLARSNTILRRYVELIIVGSLVLLAAILVARYFFGVQNDNIQRTVDLNNAKIASLQPVQKQAEELSATVNTISGLLSRNVKFSDMLTQIGGIMPPGSVLTGLKFSLEDVEAPLVVSAQVDNEQKAAVLRNNLAASSLFERAELKNITKIEEEEVSTTTPTVTATVPALTTAPKPVSAYKFTTVINAYFKPGILGGAQ
jgi:Tfp pilus assembly protein PilN